MKIILLDDADARTLLSLIYRTRYTSAAEAELAQRLRMQLADPLLGGANRPRTVIIRDEGRRPVMMVNYDTRADAEAAWNELIAESEDRLTLGEDGVMEADVMEADIDWPDS